MFGAGISGNRGPLGDTGAPRLPREGTGRGGTPRETAGVGGGGTTAFIEGTCTPNDAAAPPNEDAGPEGGVMEGGVSDGIGGRTAAGGATSARDVVSMGRDTSGAGVGVGAIDGGVNEGAGAPPDGESR
jgi:hypothetical protein